MFLFDSLSSGAGYCSALADRTEELMEEASTLDEKINNAIKQAMIEVSVQNLFH